ncbi:hypothetical protein FC36_GL000341 [Ligilactobacillus equi DSM 15833 = JCM 10991]|uniref:Uncharacterized protein n=3 Tax=Ligilactobacillus equi TaxID=137357 RepID=V7HXJ2_9LACO|nr:hypothetical protein [Ligilactobacillus equi]ETA74954.1 hypothetical protein LEQ_1822c [Ligilactobacillus equi DPC 6820]KRL83297.1 hypothetical protein FC36_GL000341 [Ligilactobacillus equi DSM 15833 = JCM 10991]
MELFGNIWVAPDVEKQTDEINNYNFNATATIEGLPFPTKYTMDALVSLAGLDTNTSHVLEVRIDNEVVYTEELPVDMLRSDASKKGNLNMTVTLKNFDLKKSGIHTFSLWMDKQRLDDFKLWFV